MLRRPVFLLALLSASCTTDLPVNVGDGRDAGEGTAPPAADAGFADAAPGPQPGDGVIWLHFPAQQGITHPSWGEALTDIAQHLPAQYGNTYYSSDKVTHGHETSHGIHAHLRNYHNDTGARANAFYALDDRAALVIEPGIRKHQIAPHVPEPLRGPRFQLYLVGQTAWDDRPLYVWDEWFAYINGAAVGVDLVEAGMWTYGWRDAVMGPLEFTVYALASGMAVAEHDPSYFATYDQFRELLAWGSRRAMELHRAGAVMEPFAWQRQDDYHEALRTHPDAAPLRRFARDTFGDTWAEEVLDLPPAP
jgi:hypothetical protein